MKDLYYMERAYELSLKGLGRTSPNPMVGAVIVKSDKIIAEGWHKKCGGDHAEIVALKKAGNKAKGAKMYVTLEPCFHYGRTAPCVDEIIKSGIKHVVIGMKDPNPLTCGKSIIKLKRNRIKTQVGVLKHEIEELNEVFVKYMKYKMPFVVAKVAQTIDGKIATRTGSSKWITSDKTRKMSRGIRDKFDAIMVGINTALVDNPRLTGVRKNKHLKKIIIDPSLKLSLKAKLFRNTAASDCIVAVSDDENKNKIKLFQNKGIRVVVCPSKQGKISLKWLFGSLAKEEISSILIEGGSNVIGNALKEKVVDKMHIYIAPKILGDCKALSSITGRSVLKIGSTLQLKDLYLQIINEDLFIEGKLCY